MIFQRGETKITVAIIGAIAMVLAAMIGAWRDQKESVPHVDIRNIVEIGNVTTIETITPLMSDSALDEFVREGIEFAITIHREGHNRSVSQQLLEVAKKHERQAQIVTLQQQVEHIDVMLQQALSQYGSILSTSTRYTPDEILRGFQRYREKIPPSDATKIQISQIVEAHVYRYKHTSIMDTQQWRGNLISLE